MQRYSASFGRLTFQQSISCAFLSRGFVAQQSRNRLNLASDVRRNVQLRNLVASSLIHQHEEGKNLRLP